MEVKFAGDEKRILLVVQTGDEWRERSNKNQCGFAWARKGKIKYTEPIEKGRKGYMRDLRTSKKSC